MSGARELGLPTNLVLLAELVLACELGLLTSLALLVVELVLAMETEASSPLETEIRFPPVLNVLVLSALLSAPFVLPPTVVLSDQGNPLALFKGSLRTS